MPTHDARAGGRRGPGSASQGGGIGGGAGASTGGRDGRGPGSFHHHHHGHKGGKVSVPKPVNLPSVLKETGTSVDARLAFNSTRTWGGASVGAGGDGGRTSGTAAGEGASERSEVALAGAKWGRADGSGALEANGGGVGSIRVLSRATEGDDRETAGAESRRRSGDRGAGGPKTPSLEYPSLGDERRANGFGIASDVVEEVRRYMKDDAREVRSRHEDEDERSIGQTPSEETETHRASCGRGGGRSGRSTVVARRVLTRPRPVEREREGSNGYARAPARGLQRNADDASVAADTSNGSRIESERVVDTPGSDLLQSRGSTAPPVVLRRTKPAVMETAPAPAPTRTPATTPADGGGDEKTKKKRGGRRVREREERRVLRASKRDDIPANGDHKSRMTSVPTPSGTSYTEWIGAQYEGTMPAYGRAFADGSGLFTTYASGYPMSGAYAYGHAGVQPQPLWTTMPTGHQAPVMVPVDAPFDINATGTYGRGSGSTKTMSVDVERIMTRLGDLPSSLGEEFGSTDDLSSFATEDATAAPPNAASASAQKPRRRPRKHAS